MLPALLAQVICVVDALRQLHQGALCFAVGLLTQQMGDAIEAGTFLASASTIPKGRIANMGALEHDFLGTGIGFQRRRDSISMGFSFHGCRSGTSG